MIEANNISYRYAGQKDLVFDDFSLKLEANNIYGLLGKNGTGKSTLLYLISGLLRPKKGSVRFDGLETRLRKPETLQEIFIVPEEFDLPSMSLEQYVRINAPFYPRQLTCFEYNHFDFAAKTVRAILRYLRTGRLYPQQRRAAPDSHYPVYNLQIRHQ